MAVAVSRRTILGVRQSPGCFASVDLGRLLRHLGPMHGTSTTSRGTLVPPRSLNARNLSAHDPVTIICQQPAGGSLIDRRTRHPLNYHESILSQHGISLGNQDSNRVRVIHEEGLYRKTGKEHLVWVWREMIFHQLDLTKRPVIIVCFEGT